MQSILKNLNKGIFVLRQTAISLRKSYNVLVYNAFIQPFLSYGILLWGGSKGTNWFQASIK